MFICGCIVLLVKPSQTQAVGFPAFLRGKKQKVLQGTNKTMLQGWKNGIKKQY
jgi:hypothetical protein